MRLAGGAPEESGGDACSDVCIHPSDGRCDDGGPGSEHADCAYGTDCSDCGTRPAATVICSNECHRLSPSEQSLGAAGDPIYEPLYLASMQLPQDGVCSDGGTDADDSGQPANTTTASPTTAAPTEPTLTLSTPLLFTRGPAFDLLVTLSNRDAATVHAQDWVGLYAKSDADVT